MVRGSESYSTNSGSRGEFDAWHSATTMRQSRLTPELVVPSYQIPREPGCDRLSGRRRCRSAAPQGYSRAPLGDGVLAGGDVDEEGGAGADVKILDSNDNAFLSACQSRPARRTAAGPATLTGFGSLLA